MFIMLLNAIQNQQQRVAGTSGQQYSSSIAGSVHFAIVLACSSVAVTQTLNRSYDWAVSSLNYLSTSFCPLPHPISTVNLVRQVPGRLHGDSCLDCRVFQPLGAFIPWSQWRPLYVPGTHLPYSKKHIVKTHLFPIKTSGEQYSIVPQNVENFLPSSTYAADPKSISLMWNLSSKMIFSSCNVNHAT